MKNKTEKNSTIWNWNGRSEKRYLYFRCNCTTLSACPLPSETVEVCHFLSVLLFLSFFWCTCFFFFFLTSTYPIEQTVHILSLFAYLNLLFLLQNFSSLFSFTIQSFEVRWGPASIVSYHSRISNDKIMSRLTSAQKAWLEMMYS